MIMSSAVSIAIIIQRDLMLATGAYNTMKSTLTSMDYSSAEILEYRSNWLSIYVVFTLKYILGHKGIKLCQYRTFY